ncbi:pyruvate, water dikinase regulatory protein [Sporohalobacter salinus]|uniref:pyruvate, water dikinase regulatory protein n=1 Tax=Sporohalobacter salinus TaxID=1494606 RepID=UPI00196046E5|nr:pyruvate, water dikinase regulatory protein [Sporohalobacter salinus]MBM7623190.1 regulator of PEP synthase PpsR (kinase-PPPase family) [Sporohalobacter salinus]
MLSSTNDKDLTVFIVSDSIGETAETVVSAVASQFGTDQIELKKFTNVTSIAKLSEIISRAKDRKVIIAYTIVLPELCEYLEETAQTAGIPTIDIIGPIMSKFSELLGQKPELEPGLNRKLDQEYFERISCIDYAIRCDDGKDLRKLEEADVVIIGVSRTSKTPLSMYLAHQGYKAANIPLVPEVNVPQELYDLPSKKLIGLTIDPTILRNIREERLHSMKFKKQADYATTDRILEELDFAEEIMKSLGCMIINVTNKSIEETANRILSERSDL